MRIKKICGKCGDEKSLGEFGKKKTAEDGRQPWCKKCNSAYLAEWYKNNKLPHRADIRRRQSAFLRQAQQFVVEYLLDHPCISCGEDDPVVLEFDHRDRSKKKLCIGQLTSKVSSMNFSVVKDEMDKCDVRCANCHRKKSAKEMNYRRYQVCVEMKIIDY